MIIKNLTDKFIDKLYLFSKKEFTNKEIMQAKRCLLDYLGVTYAGSYALGEKRSLLLKQFDRGLSESSLIGFDKRVSFEGAAYINGISGHVLELDDGSRFGGIHPGAPIFSALLSLVEKEDINSENLIKGIITGYEASIRLASAIQPNHNNRGYHPTGTCGTIGATVALAVALDFTREQLKLAFSNAVVNSSGSLKVLEDASEIKPINVGIASLNAIMAIQNARIGFKVPDDVLSGENGFINMMAREYNEDILLNEDTKLGIEKIYFKLYSACRHCHSPIEASFKIREKIDFSIKDIKEINIYTYNYVIHKHAHKKVFGTTSAKMSVPYSVAIALLYGKAGENEYSLQKTKDLEVLSLLNKIEVIEDEKLSKLVPEIRPAIVEVVFNNLKRYNEKVEFPRGEPENPLTNVELENKFRELSLYGDRSNEEVDEIIRCVWNIEDSLEDLFKVL